MVASNDYGFNTIYIHRGLVEKEIPGVSVKTVLSHPRNFERARLFDAIKDWKYVEV